LLTWRRKIFFLFFSELPLQPTKEKMMDDGGRRRGQHTERQRREHLVIPRTPTANNVDAVLSSADSDSAFFRSAANGAPYSPLNLEFAPLRLYCK
jgi:hypothetical protein